MAGPDDAYQPVAQSKRERGEKRVARQPERYTFHEPFSSAYTVPCASFSRSTFAAFLLLFPSSIACYTAIHSLVGERKRKKSGGNQLEKTWKKVKDSESAVASITTPGYLYKKGGSVWYRILITNSE